MLPIGLFSAPLEKKAGTFTEAAPTGEVVSEAVSAPTVLAWSREIPKFHYRPPPHDSRFERVRNQIFRI